MYVFGGLGNANGLFGQPTALDVTADGRYLVVDGKYGKITVFKPTEYGKLVTDAVIAYQNRDYEKSAEYWVNALKYTSSSELVYDGVANSYYRRGEYKSAMYYYKLAKNREGYSEAWKHYRNEIVTEYFPLLMATIIILIVAFFGFKIWRAVKRGKKRWTE